MRIEFDPGKQDANLRKHGLDFSLAGHVFGDPLKAIVFDRIEGGEERWHAFGWIAGRLLLVVHIYPDPDDEDWVRIIGMRAATSHERRLYEDFSAP